MKYIDMKCPYCGSNCYVWGDGELTEALMQPLFYKEFPIYCINDCGIVGTIQGRILFKKESIKMKSKISKETI